MNNRIGLKKQFSTSVVSASACMNPLTYPRYQKNICMPYAYEQVSEECIVMLAKMARMKSYQKQLEV